MNSEKKNEDERIRVPSLKRIRLKQIAFLGGVVFFILLSMTSWKSYAQSASDDPSFETEKPLPQSEQPKSKLKGIPNENGEFRNFYQVLEDVLADFEYDLRNGNVSGLKQLAIRNIATSENIPPSFKDHLDLLIKERVLLATKKRMINCLPCRSQQAVLKGDLVTVTTPQSNPVQLTRIAKQMSIQNFMDVAFAYQPNGLILSLSIAEADGSGSVIWSRSYNSETSRAAAIRRGVDYGQLDEARKTVEYEPMVVHRPQIYYLFEPDLDGLTGVLGFAYRMVERYDNRKKEVGFELNYLMDSGSLVGAEGTENAIYRGFNLTLLFVHAWNLIGPVESYNKVRGSIFAAVGGTYAGGFLGALFRGGYEWRLGKHWAVSAILGYRPQATLFLNGTSSGTISGIEFGVGISALF